MFSLIILTALLSGLPGGLGISVGPSVSSLAPMETEYSDRFLTPGLAYGLVASLDAPGPLAIHVGSEYFSKKATSGWDGEVSSLLFWAFPCGQYKVMDGFGLFAGPGLVGVNGNYSGTDDFGSYIEETGSSVGFAVSVGSDIFLWGPLSARLEYRHSWLDMKSDRVLKDGVETILYPAIETDLGYSQYIFALDVVLFPIDEV